MRPRLKSPRSVAHRGAEVAGGIERASMRPRLKSPRSGREHAADVGELLLGFNEAAA